MFHYKIICHVFCCLAIINVRFTQSNDYQINRLFGDEYQKFWDNTLAVIFLDKQTHPDSMNINKNKHSIQLEEDKDLESDGIWEVNDNKRNSESDIERLWTNLYRKDKYQPSQITTRNNQNSAYTKTDDSAIDKNDKRSKTPDTLRKWESCYKKARKYCYKASKSAYKAYCSSFKCKSRMKKKFKKEYKRACKEEFS